MSPINLLRDCSLEQRLTDLHHVAFGFISLCKQRSERIVSEAAILLGLDICKHRPDHVKMAIFVNKEDISPYASVICIPSRD